MPCWGSFPRVWGRTLLPEPLGTDACSLARRWVLDAGLAGRLVALDRELADRFATSWVRWPGLWIISGYRSRARQAEINPAAPDSLHTRCPSLAADLRVGGVPAGGTEEDLWWVIGMIWETLGGRWGGRFDPPDPNHFDLGYEAI